MTKEEILELLEKKHVAEMREEILKLNSVNISEILKELELKEAFLVYRMLPKDVAVEVFSYLEPEDQERFIAKFNDVELTELMEELYFDDVIDMIEEMPALVVKRILSNSSKENRKLINQFLNYEEDSAGSLMTIEYVSLKEYMNVSQAMEHIRAVGKDKQTIYTCYITDSEKKLKGLVSLRTLILSEENQLIADIASYEDIVTVYSGDDQEHIADKFKKYDLITMPVTDYEGRLIGIITIDDIVDVIEEETTEDIQMMAAINPMDDSYADTGPILMARKRIPWLAILMISASLTSAIISRYQSALAQMTVLSSFIPLLTGTSGNAGAQTSTLVIRSLSLGEIKLQDVLKVVWKEMRVGFTVGLVLAVINFFRLFYLEIALVNEPEKLKISIMVSITLMFTIIMSKTVGGLLPIAVKAVNLDPALMANPLITTLIDVLSLIVYFNLIGIIFGI
jgi:magnesium transporter